MTNSSFHEGYFFAISAQTSLNGFLLILQTAELSTKNESCCFTSQDWWVGSLFGLRFDIGCLAEGHTEAAMCVMWWLQKCYLRT